ncbi:hypothetical protein THAOC_34858 [Thalassiosira oceanica]|uniref:Uncharacterized protein n=1 Tax=Thalassiosira oceanica TaxID=159749 RepID=K0RBK4_THAOC|nr:hypothetical protein THAOC_34858 [Thalassiosira oceanica]|eukprot:EJK46471.1 hypothetical protein THAOC_34858 [Thalassiosira oceanica]
MSTTLNAIFRAPSRRPIHYVSPHPTASCHRSHILKRFTSMTASTSNILRRRSPVATAMAFFAISQRRQTLFARDPRGPILYIGPHPKASRCPPIVECGSIVDWRYPFEHLAHWSSPTYASGNVGLALSGPLALCCFSYQGISSPVQYRRLFASTLRAGPVFISSPELFDGQRPGALYCFVVRTFPFSAPPDQTCQYTKEQTATWAPHFGSTAQVVNCPIKDFEGSFFMALRPRLPQ